MAQEQPRPNKADLKIVMLGPHGVGKTCLVTRYTYDTFRTDTRFTIGASFALIPWGTKHAALWDTAGQERFSGLAKHYSRNVDAAVLCYDVTNGESFDRMKLNSYPLIRDQEGCLRVVVGCKGDLIGSERSSDEISQGQSQFYQREISTESALDFAREINPNSEWVDAHSVPCFETSSKTGKNVKEMFHFILHQKLGDPESPIRSNPNFQYSKDDIITIPRTQTPKKKCPC